MVAVVAAVLIECVHVCGFEATQVLPPLGSWRPLKLSNFGNWIEALLGGKGANLAEMSSIGLSVPAGFTVTTETCAEFHANGAVLPDGCWEEMLEGLELIEKCMGKKLGDPANPLLLSVRSGASVSMPGMMDTVLNLGLNDVVVEGLAVKAGATFAFDSYRRFLDMYGDVVMVGTSKHCSKCPSKHSPPVK